MAVELSVRQALVADKSAVLSILQEYYDAASVVVRDATPDVDEYLRGRGGFWLAQIAEATVGCIAIRPLDNIGAQVCEVKRLYVAPDHRSQGIADLLYGALEAFARSRGFRSIYLDTTDGMQAAIRFYERHGFEYCQRYNDNPQATLFMRKSLA
ncbi:MAG: GNAT family N-acetyltransferase [Candidatus Eremiobacteraeota bacterium]|nr:GNAT family N-acetyltransferase [Candidatus Eremiobacteraeota bacterium]